MTVMNRASVLNNRKDEAARAVELLEEYHSRLTRPADRQLRDSVQRVITVFRSQLFQALLDIQEYYESCIVDGETMLQSGGPIPSSQFTTMPPYQGAQGGTISTIQMATMMAGTSHATPPMQRGPQQNMSLQRQQQHHYPPPMEPPAPPRPYPPKSAPGPGVQIDEPHLSRSQSMGVQGAPSDSMMQQRGGGMGMGGGGQSTMPKNEPKQDLVQGYAVQGYAPPVQAHPPPAVMNADQVEYSGEGDNEYEDLVMTLHKGPEGLGFSIAGGKDNPHIGTDPHIYITKIIPGGNAEQEGTLRVNDILLSVNETSTENVTHAQAVETLKRTPNVVRMMIRRIQMAAAEKLIEIDLVKGESGLGFSIAGGIGNNHVPGDCGIFVTKIIPGGAAEAEGQLEMGDRIIAVRSWESKNPKETMFDKNLENVYHEEAVGTLKRIKENVILVVAKPAKLPLETILPENYSSAPGSMPQGSPIKSVQQHGHTPSDGYGYPHPEPMMDDRIDQGRLEMESHHMQSYRESSMSQNQQDLMGLSNVAPPPPLNSQPMQDHGYGDGAPSNRVVRLTRGPTGLGFNIVGGEDNEGIFVSFILPGGVADLSGSLQRGDQIIAVNNTNLTYATHVQAAQALKSAGQTVTLEVVYRPDEYARFEAKIHELREQMISSNSQEGTLQTAAKKSFYVRALFDFAAGKDKAIPGSGHSFVHGDILHVHNATDEEWWAATLVVNGTPGVNESGVGLIPSKRRIERKERQRIKSVKFQQNQQQESGGDRRSNTLDKKKKGGLLKKFTLSKSKDSDLDSAGGAGGGIVVNSDVDQSGGHYTSNASDSEGSLKGGMDGSETTILSYELVTQIEVDYKRPIVILGPWKDKVNDDLISDQPDKFGSCVPHTTRKKRDYEVDGRDYHFMESREEMERDIAAGKFIEAGQYNENLYGTSLRAVEDVCVVKKKHCILDVSGNAIKRLILAQIYPVAIFIRPKSTRNILDTMPRWTEQHAARIFERSQKTEADFVESFTAIVEGDTYDEIYDKCRRVIENNSDTFIWVPSKEKL